MCSSCTGCQTTRMAQCILCRSCRSNGCFQLFLKTLAERDVFFMLSGKPLHEHRAFGSLCCVCCRVPLERFLEGNNLGSRRVALAT